MGPQPHGLAGGMGLSNRHARLIRVEDPFFRSVRPGRSGDGPLGLLIDQQGCHYDAATPSDLETLLAPIHWMTPPFWAAPVTG